MAECLLGQLDEPVVKFNYCISGTPFVGYKSIRPESSWGKYALYDFVAEHWPKFQKLNRRLLIAWPSPVVLTERKKSQFNGHSIYELPDVSPSDIVEFVRVGGRRWSVVKHEIEKVFAESPFEVSFADSHALNCFFLSEFSRARAKHYAQLLSSLSTHNDSRELLDQIMGERRFNLSWGRAFG